MEGALVCVVLIAATVIYWKRKPIKNAFVIAGIIAVVAFVILVVLQVLASQIDWRAPSLRQVAVRLGVFVLLATGVLWGMPALIRKLDARRAHRPEEAVSDEDISLPPHPEPIRKIDPLWRRLFRKGE